MEVEALPRGQIAFVEYKADRNSKKPIPVSGTPREFMEKFGMKELCDATHNYYKKKTLQLS